MSTLSARIIHSLHVAWPITASRLLIAISSFIGMLLLASLGPETLAAAALIYGLQTAIMVIFASLLFSISPIASRAYGAQDFEKVGSVLQQAWLLSTLMTLPLLVLTWFAGDLLRFFGENPGLTQIATRYFHVFVLALIPTFFFFSHQLLTMGVGKQRLALLSSAISCSFLVFFSVVLTYGKLGFPALGVTGVAWGMVAGQWSGSLFSGICLLTMPYFKPFEFLRFRIKRSIGCLWQLLHIGWPIMVQMGGELLLWFTVTLLIGWVGMTALSAQQIVNQYNILIIVPIMGLTQASSILIGHASGAKQYSEVKNMGYTHMAMGVVLMIVVMIAYLAFPEALIHFYLRGEPHASHALISLTRYLLAISAFALLFDSLRNITIGALRGLYDSRFPMYLSVWIMWGVGLPLGCLLGFALHLGAIGFALANLLAVLVCEVVLFKRWGKRTDILLHSAASSDQKVRNARETLPT